jgi:hypothetical protein
MNNATTAETGCESPFACNIGDLKGDDRLRWSALLGQLDAQKLETRETEDGYRFRYSADPAIINSIAEWITYERICCPFFDFELKVESKGVVWLRLSGENGVKDFIRGEFRIGV